MNPADLGVDIKPRLKTLKVTEPPSRDGGEIVENIDALIEKLKNEARGNIAMTSLVLVEHDNSED